jgi:protein MpaA
VTNLTPEQFGIVCREVRLMIAEGEWEEAGRIARMFASGRFNYPALPFPVDGPATRDYRKLAGKIHSLDAEVFRVEEIGCGLLKVVSRSDGIPICLVAGIHGDEADGILAALEFAQRFARSADLRGTYRLTVYPCVNPTGYVRMSRENAAGKDLNREFFRDSDQPEVRIIERELKAQAFTGFISGHSDYESFGIYAYATGAVLSERLAKPALFQASSVIPINLEPVIDGHPASYGIINEKFPGSLGPLSGGDSEPFDIVIETPNLFALRKRVEAQAVAFETILQEYRAVASEAMYL